MTFNSRVCICKKAETAKVNLGIQGKSTADAFCPYVGYKVKQEGPHHVLVNSLGFPNISSLNY